MYIFSPWGLCGPYGCWTNAISLPPIGTTIHFHNSHIYNRGWGDREGGVTFYSYCIVIFILCLRQTFSSLTHSAKTSLMSIISGKKCHNAHRNRCQTQWA